MQFKLTFSAERAQKIPLNYQYPLSAWIYKTFTKANPQFANWLHQHGYAFNGNRRFKLFTYSWLQTQGAKMLRQKQSLRLPPGPHHFYISFHIEEAAAHFISGLFQNQELVIAGPQSVGRFAITNAERLPQPNFTSGPTVFHCLSPVVVSRSRGKAEKGLPAEYLSPNQAEYSKLLHANVLKRYAAAHQSLLGMVSNGHTFEALADFPFDSGHWQFHLLGQARKRGQKMKEGTPQQTQVIGYTYRFRLDAPQELQEFIWNAGLGEKGSTGWGCVEPIPQTK